MDDAFGAGPVGERSAGQRTTELLVADRRSRKNGDADTQSDSRFDRLGRRVLEQVARHLALAEGRSDLLIESGTRREHEHRLIPQRRKRYGRNQPTWWSHEQTRDVQQRYR